MVTNKDILKINRKGASDELLIFLKQGTVLIIEPVREKTNNLGSDQVRHKQGCTVTEDG